MRKDRPFVDGSANWSTRPFAALQGRRNERAEGRKKSDFGNSAKTVPHVILLSAVHSCQRLRFASK
jgi:hypothetical protein